MAQPTTTVWRFHRHGHSRLNFIGEQYAATPRVDLFTPEVLATPDRAHPLTAKGIEQAKASGEWHSRNFPGHYIAVTSEFVRAKQTLQEGFNRKADHTLPQFNERTWSDEWSRRHPSLDWEARDRFDADEPHNPALRGPEGESAQDVYERVSQGIDTLEMMYPTQDILVVGHGHATLIAMMVMEGTPLTPETWYEARQNRNELRNCGFYLCRIEVGEGPVQGRLLQTAVVNPVDYDKEIAWREMC